MTLNTIKGVKKFANFDKSDQESRSPTVVDPLPPVPQNIQNHAQTLGLNLGYTINLNLPATSDIAVFNAIFKSLKENLLSSPDEQ
jgi:hypothetical protein